METICLYNKKHQEFLKTNYKIGGDGVAFDSTKAFKNFLFFHNIKITGFKNANGSKLIYLDSKLYKRYGIDLILSDSIKENANDILVLQNGDYVLQQYKDNKLTSLFSGYHKAHILEIDYRFARDLLNNIDFKSFDSNIKRTDNQIVIIDFIKLSNKFIAKTKYITIDSKISCDEKKEFIRKYDNRYKNSIIMHNNNLFYILSN